MTFKQAPENKKEGAVPMWGKVVEAEDTASAKALREV